LRSKDDVHQLEQAGFLSVNLFAETKNSSLQDIIVVPARSS